MKKIIFCLLLVTGLLLTTSCEAKPEDKYAKYEHYKEKQFNNSSGQPIRYIFNNAGEQNIYVVADITSEESEINTHGLLYKVGEDDYIPLEKIYGDTYALFYQDWKNNLNKLYIGQLEYILDKEKITKRALKLDIPDVPEEMIKSYEKDTNHKVDSKYAKIYGIKNATPEFIYYRADLQNLYRTITVKCSLESFDCEYSEE